MNEIKKNIKKYKTLLFFVLSIWASIYIACHGTGKSFIETNMINAIITLFGVAITGSIFISQALENNSTEESKDLLTRIHKSLAFVLNLIIIAIFLDLIIERYSTILFEVIYYFILFYSTIVLDDVLNGFFKLCENISILK